MANVKISDLTGAASASGTQEFEVNDSGTSKKVTGSQLATFIEGEVSSSPTFTGQVSLDNGTNTAPSLTNTGDTNTGLYFPSDDTVALTAGGSANLSVNSSGVSVDGNVTFGDSDKAIFGAGSDLQIYHDGAKSVIHDAGTGNLLVRATNLSFANDAWSANYLTATDGAEVNIYYNNSIKLATTSTGIDVTGTVTAGGLTVDGGAEIRNPDKTSLNIVSTDSSIIDTQVYGNLNFISEDGSLEGGRKIVAGLEAVNRGGAGSYAAMDFYTSYGTGVALTVPRLRIDYNGDISFYEDTGTTPKFFWDASAESLGIGTSSPARALHVNSGTANEVARFESTDTEALIELVDTTGSAQIRSRNDLRFYTNGGSTRAMDIDSSGNVGIGTNLPADLLDVRGNSGSDKGINIKNDGTGRAVAVLDSGINSSAFIRFKNQGTATGQVSSLPASPLVFSYGASNTEAMRIDTSGNLLVGTTAYQGSGGSGAKGFYAGASGLLSSARSGATVAVLNRTTSDGAIVEFRKDGSTVGSIGNRFGAMYVHSPDGTNGAGLRFFDGVIQPCESNGNDSDNDTDLGQVNSRFDDIYATNGTIQTSDRNEKQDIEALSDAEQRVAVACKGLLRKFRWKDAVAEKGDDARIHFGIIAQDLQDAFVAEGLDAGRYAMFISSTWTDEETGEERTRMGVRYSELLAFIIAAI